MGSIADHMSANILPADPTLTLADRQMALFSALGLGTGSPEGVVTAPIGSLFMRKDGGSGTTLYTKESGAGNTGWSPLDSASFDGTNYVPLSLYDANTILAATTDNNPVALTVGASTIVGRKAAGGIVALTGSDVITITGASLDSAVVHNTGTENVGGQKTFTTGIIVNAGGFQVGSSGRMSLNGNAVANDRMINSGNTAHPDGTDAVLYGIFMSPTFPSNATSSGTQIYAQVRTAAAAFTMTDGYGVYVEAPNVGAGSAMTRNTGLRIANQGNAGVVTSYGINIAAQSGSGTANYGLRVDSGTTSAMWIGGDVAGTTIVAGVYFGSGRDVGMYRNGANAFTIDASSASGLTLTGGLTVPVTKVINCGEISQAPTATGVVHYLLNAPSGQSVNIFDVQLNAVSKLSINSAGTVIVGAQINMGGNQVFSEGINIQVGTTTGTKIGLATTQKLGFFNATPVVQEAGSNDILASLVTLGFRAASSNPPLNMGTGTLTCGDISQTPTATGTVHHLLNAPSGQSANIMDIQLNGSTKLRINSGGTVVIGGQLSVSGVNILMDTTTGTIIGTTTAQKFSFWAATPIVQPTTGVAAATFVANTSLIANDSATFDGYTIGQVVKALRNVGLLA